VHVVTLPNSIHRRKFFRRQRYRFGPARLTG
jgi:hypothetical protein